MHDARTKLADEVATEVRKFFGQKVYETVIPRNVRVAEAPSHGKPLLLYDHKSAGSRAYMDLAAEMINRERAAAAHAADFASSGLYDIRKGIAIWYQRTGNAATGPSPVQKIGLEEASPHSSAIMFRLMAGYCPPMAKAAWCLSTACGPAHSIRVRSFK